MPVEIEAKMQVTDMPAVRRTLEAIDATRVGRVLEVNTFFDKPDRSLLAADQGLRVREDINENDESRFRVTFKGPRKVGVIKNREEIELAVDSGEGATALLESLGFVRTLRFEKRRESWSLGDCDVELDQLPLLGDFVEIEGPNEAAIEDCRRRLGMDNNALTTASYAALVMQHLQEEGITSRELSFENFE